MHFGGTLTQSAADVTASITFPTGITANTDFVLKVHRVEFFLDPTRVRTWTAGLTEISAIVRAVGNNTGFEELFTIALTDNAVGITTVLIPTQYADNLQDDFPLIGDESITISLNTANTGAINILDWRIDYERVVLAPAELNKALLRVF